MLVKLAFLIVLVLTLACGQSPLLNHTNASVKKESQRPNGNSPCPFQFEKVGVCFSLFWKKGPDINGHDEFYMQFWDKNLGSSNGPYINPGHDLKITLHMPMMDHPANPPTIKPSGDGFDVTEVIFTMGMMWEVWFELFDHNLLIDKVTYEINL